MLLLCIVIYLVFAGAVSWSQFLTEARWEGYNDIFCALVCAYASTTLYGVSRQFDDSDAAKKCWRYFSIGIGLEALGAITYSLFEFVLDRVVDFPSIADAFIIVGNIFCIRSFSMFLREMNRMEIVPTGKRVMMSNILVGILGVLTIVFIVIPVVNDPAEPLWLRWSLQIYPLLDLILAYYCIHLILAFCSMGYSPVAKPWMAMVLAYVFFLIADSAYAYQSAMDQYSSYSFIPAGWGLSYLTIAYASQLQSKLMKQFSPGL